MTRANKIKIILILLFTLVTLLVSGCKDNSPTEPIKTNRELLIQTWDLKRAFDIGTDPSHPIDVTNQINYAYIKFNSDGSYTSSVMKGKWELDDANNQIILDKNTATQITADIIKLTTDTLRAKMEISFANPPTIYQFTFVANENVGNRSPELNFETLWKEFDERYAFFEIKNINWDSLYSVYRPQVTSNTTDLQLFQIMSSLLAILKDGHADLTTPYGRFAYTGWYSNYPHNFLGTDIIKNYLTIDYGKLANGYLRYGKVQNNIGYIYIGPNLTGDVNVWSEAIDVIIDSLKNTKGIVVDIRDNGGGNDILGWTIAGRFTDQTITYSFTRSRNGKEHSDFTGFTPHTIQPLDNYQYLKPVAFLTNRHSFSSAEGTTLMFRSISHVTVIGDTTGGGSANPITLRLPNGWTFRVPRWIQYTADKKIFEGIGLAPDIPVWISPADSAAGRDAILERAIQFLSK